MQEKLTRFKVFMTMTIKPVKFWDRMLCSVVWNDVFLPTILPWSWWQ